jgi:hypothetical protein
MPERLLIPEGIDGEACGVLLIESLQSLKRALKEP